MIHLLIGIDQGQNLLLDFLQHSTPLLLPFQHSQLLVRVLLITTSKAWLTYQMVLKSFRLDRPADIEVWLLGGLKDALVRGVNVSRPTENKLILVP